MFQLQDYFYVRNLAENSSISIHFIGTNFADIALFGVFRELRKKLFHKNLNSIVRLSSERKVIYLYQILMENTLINIRFLEMFLKFSDYGSQIRFNQISTKVILRSVSRKV